MHKLVLVLMASIGVAGCATNQPIDTTQAAVDRQILESAQAVQSALVELYHAGALNSSILLGAPRPSDPRITQEWHGDALQLLNKLAHDRGQSFAFIGVRLPLPISVNVRNESYASVLNQIRAQIGYRATLEQHPDKLVLHYNRPPSS